MKKKGFTTDGLMQIMLWVIFLTIAGAGVYFLIKKLTG